MKILAFDDSQLMRYFIQKHLAAIGFEVMALGPGSLFEALGALREHRPGLVVTDYEMPGCNGESLVRGIREDPELNQTPVLIHSSHGESDLITRLGEWGRLGYLLKPASAERLQEAACELCRTHGLPLPEGAKDLGAPKE